MQRGTPYRRLGQRLRSIRQSLQETLPEVSGAVELDSDVLASYERGEARPSEDVLDLLISYFDIKDNEADELWELAGYSRGTSVDDMLQLPTLVMVPMDNRVVYTDTANIAINNFGVVMNFMQSGPNNQPVNVARVGMSLEHAKSVLEVLQKTIAQAEATRQPKLLPRADKKAKEQGN